MSRLIGYKTDEELVRHLWHYDELGFQDIPEWLREGIKSRGITFKRRQPTPQEQRETEDDAKYHRLTHNEPNIEDFYHKYKIRKLKHV